MTPTNPPTFPRTGAATYTLVLLMAAAVVSLLDRQILSLLIIPIKADFSLTDVQASYLQGLSFAVFYALMGLPFGYLVDRTNRRTLIVFAMAFWSLATIASGLAQSYPQLFLARMCVGAGEACLMPAAYSMLYDLYGPRTRGRAYSIFGAAATVGHASSLLLAAVIVATLTSGPFAALPLLRDLEGWRVAMIVAGVPGLLISLLMLTVREPRRLEIAGFQLIDGRAPIGLRAFMRANAVAMALVIAVASLIYLCGFGAIAWMAAGYVRTYGLPLTEAGFICGAILLCGAFIGAPLGGWLADRFAQRGARGGRLLVAVLTSAAGALLFPVWWLCGNLPLSIALGCLAFTVQVGGATVLPSALSDLAPNHLRGRLQAVYLIAVSLVGLGLGPTLIAMVTQNGFGRESALNLGIAVVTGSGFALAAIIGWSGRAAYSRALPSGAGRQSAETGAAEM